MAIDPISHVSATFGSPPSHNLQAMLNYFVDTKLQNDFNAFSSTHPTPEDQQVMHGDLRFLNTFVYPLQEKYPDATKLMSSTAKGIDIFELGHPYNFTQDLMTPVITDAKKLFSEVPAETLKTNLVSYLTKSANFISQLLPQPKLQKVTLSFLACELKSLANLFVHFDQMGIYNSLNAAAETINAVINRGSPVDIPSVKREIESAGDTIASLQA